MTGAGGLLPRAATGDRPAAPTLDDPLARAASESIGGPIGDHAGGHPWWTPVRVVLAVVCVTFLLGMVQKWPCVAEHWTGGNQYSAMCYSDMPSQYLDRGYAERLLPYSDNGGRYPPSEYPVVIGYFQYAATLVTQALHGWPDLAPRAAVAPGQVYTVPGVSDESQLFVLVNAVLLAPFALLAGWFLARSHRGRPWDAMLYAAAPVLALNGLINWDILALCATAGAIWAWARGRPVLSGVLIGLGTATKLYPLFLLGALLVVSIRRSALRTWAVTTITAGAAWLVVNLPPILYGYDQWKAFWTQNQQRGADLGSLWLVWQQGGHLVGTSTINTVSWVFFAAVCLGVLLLGLLAPQTPRWPQLAYLILVGFLVVNKVYSPQYVLWLLPLAILARPRWRDILIWQLCEVFYFGMVWFYLGGYTASSAVGVPDHAYWFAILVRVAGELYLAVRIVLDVLDPWRDPVRADALTDDPAWPEALPA